MKSCIYFQDWVEKALTFCSPRHVHFRTKLELDSLLECYWQNFYKFFRKNPVAICSNTSRFIVQDFTDF